MVANPASKRMWKRLKWLFSLWVARGQAKDRNQIEIGILCGKTMIKRPNAYNVC